MLSSPSQEKRVLVVDDDPTTRFMMSEFIETLGYTSETVGGGMACLARLADTPYNYAMILMDIHMPDVTGLDATTYIRDFDEDPPRSIPIVAVTADSEYNSILSVAAYGMDDVLIKPVSLATLDRLLTAYLKPTKH